MAVIDQADFDRRMGEIGFYHSIDLGPGVATKGWWDLRHALTLIPFPDVRGKRCLDIGTWDGFYAFELERRGAAEVVALDLPDVSQVDYPPEVRADRSFNPSPPGQPSRNAGFHLVHEALDSAVIFRPGNVYDLDPADVGTFDVVTMGSLLLHLRDPVRALDAVRAITSMDGFFLSIDFIHPNAQLRSRRTPLFELRGEGSDFQWWLANDAGCRQLLRVGGFDIDATSPFFLLRPGDPAEAHGESGMRGATHQILKRALTKDRTKGGHLHRAYLSHRRF